MLFVLRVRQGRCYDDYLHGLYSETWAPCPRFLLVRFLTGFGTTARRRVRTAGAHEERFRHRYHPVVD
jgi:hypothetical protein